MVKPKDLHFLAAFLLTSTTAFAQEEPAVAADSATAPVAAPEAAIIPDTLPPVAPAETAATPETASDAAAPPAPSQRGASRVMEEIIVTSQKREERLADVPISVSAFSGEKLEALGIKGPNELPQITPGMQYDSLIGYSVIYLRGVGTEIFLPNSDPSVATYIDGIYFPFSHGLATDFGKLERVEVLKGPQGTLFGRNSTGGAINVVTAKPNPDQIEGTLGYEVGKFDTRNFKGYISGPLTDKLAAGFSVLANQASPYYSRPEDSRFAPFPDERTVGFNVKLNWEPTDNLGMTLNGISTRQTGLSSVVTTGFDAKPLGLGFDGTQLNAISNVFALLGINGGILAPNSPGRYVSDPDDDIHFRASSDVAFGEVRYSPGLYNIKFLSSYQAISTDTSFDFEGTSADTVNFHPKDQAADITTAELQFLSEDGGWLTEIFGRKFQWITGLYYFNSDKAGFRNLEVPVADGILDFPAFDNLLDGLADQSGISLPSGADLRLTAYVNTVAYAAFAQGTYSFTDKASLTLGARYQDETRDLRNSTTRLLNSDGTDTLLIPFPNDSQTSKQLSPKATLDYKFADNSLVFGSVQRGYKSGTFNIVNIYTVAGEVKPEKLTNYELGIKGQNSDGSFRYSGGIFQNDIDNLQTLFISLSSGGAVTIENAGKARIRGLDFDLLWQPLPDALPGLVLTGSGAYLDGEYLSYKNGSGFDPLTGIFFSGTGAVVGGGPLPGRDFSGNDTVRTPKYSYNVGATYSVDAPGGKVEVGGALYYNDGYFFSAQNKANVAQPSYYLLNARASYLHQSSGVRISVFGKNLTNEFYWYNQFETDFNTIGTAAPPRSWSVRLDYQF